jgi:AraC family transcriptional regulator
VPIPDLPNATAHWAKRTIANPPVITVIAGHAVERAARHSNVCRPMGVLATHHMGAGSGKSMQHAELIQLDRHLKKTAPFFCELCLPQTSVCSEETLQRELGGVEHDKPPMDGVMTEGYGQRFGERLRVENAPAMVTRALRNADMAVTEIRCDNPPLEMTGAFQREDAFVITLHLRDRPNHEYWEDGRRAMVCDFRAGDICLHDLKRDPSALLDRPYHTLFFYLPRVALDTIADEANVPRIRDLSYKPGAAVNDATISSLGSLLQPALSHPDQVNRLFVDHVLLAVGVHIAQTYGGMRPVPRLVRGGLAPWQERRAKEMIAANLDGVPVKELARECRLSTAHFSRAFRRSVGVAPHNWLIEQRIALSKEKLRDDRLSLAKVAAECGFCDQSHFTRHFGRIVGVSPRAWRRALKE